MNRTFWLVTATLIAATNPATSVAQSLVIRGTTVHTLAGPTIPGGMIVVEDGRITAVGIDVTIPSGAPVLDAPGLHVYPGFFDALTQLGLTEIGSIDVTDDTGELGEFNPHLLGYTAVHAPSEHIPTARANGITHAVTAPDARASSVGGQASVIHLNGWTVEEMLVSPSVGFIFDWPTIPAFGQQSFREAREAYDGQVQRLERWLEDARRYDTAVQAGQEVARDLKLEAFSKLTRQELPLLINVNQERYIRDAIEFADSEDIRVVILGGRQAWKLPEELATQGIPVILGQTQALPSGPDERYDEQYAAPAVLYEAGVQFAFATFSSSDSRTLPFQAGNAVPYGLPLEEALKAITIRAAEIYGLADQFGTIEAGKVANLILTDGDPLEYTTQIRHIVIEGQEVDLANRHLDLYETYRGRPRP